MGWGDRFAYAILYDVYDYNGLQVYAVPDDHQDLRRLERKTSYETYNGATGNLVRRNSFMMRFRTVGAGSNGDDSDIDKVVFFAHDGSDRPFRLWIYGRKYA